MFKLLLNKQLFNKQHYFKNTIRNNQTISMFNNLKNNDCNKYCLLLYIVLTTGTVIENQPANEYLEINIANKKILLNKIYVVLFAPLIFPCDLAYYFFVDVLPLLWLQIKNIKIKDIKNKDAKK